MNKLTRYAIEIDLHRLRKQRDPRKCEKTTENVKEDLEKSEQEVWKSGLQLDKTLIKSNWALNLKRERQKAKAKRIKSLNLKKWKGNCLVTKYSGAGASTFRWRKRKSKKNQGNWERVAYFVAIYTNVH